jgi:hypothetical protein
MTIWQGFRMLGRGKRYHLTIWQAGIRSRQAVTT